MWCWSSVCPHRAIVNLLQPASTQCGVGPVFVPHRAIVNLLQPASTQCGVGPVCVPIELLSTYFNPVWCWSSVCPHRAIVSLLQPASTQCGVGPVCVPHRAIVNLLQPASTQCDIACSNGCRYNVSAILNLLEAVERGKGYTASTARPANHTHTGVSIIYRDKSYHNRARNTYVRMYKYMQESPVPMIYLHALI